MTGARQQLPFGTAKLSELLKGAGLLQLLVAGGRSLGCKAGCVVGAEAVWSEVPVSGNFSAG